MRFSVDTGGTFTDLVVELGDGSFAQFKSPTTPEDPVIGVLEVLSRAAEGLGMERPELLGQGELFIHATTRALNAIITGNVARTAFLVTEGHRDLLLLREGGRTDIFDASVRFPPPYIPRDLTFEVPERLDVDGNVLLELDRDRVREIARQMREMEVEAAGICLLWSPVNPTHELAVAELLRAEMPDISLTLSHQLNTALREYRRASSTCIDASLKPVMNHYLNSLSERVREAGFGGRMLMVTSGGGVLDVGDVAAAPIHSIGSGPASAPVAARFYADLDLDTDTAIVADTGGTSFDVSIVNRGELPRTRETWIGGQYRGHMTGFPSVDVRSIGAGGGSLAQVDSGGLLTVGPASAGSVPGPVSYGRGGKVPTVTDASVALGHIDPGYFLGGEMKLDYEGARRAIEEQIAEPLGLTIEAAASAILSVATENMVTAIEDATVRQGLDPRTAALVGGGGAAGLNLAAIAKRLDSPYAIIPEVGATLSAAGALMADLTALEERTLLTSSADFDLAAVSATFAELNSRCQDFIERAGAGGLDSRIEYSVEARYPSQVWELEVALAEADPASPGFLPALKEAFHAAHRELFGIEDRDSEIEMLNWKAQVSCRIWEPSGNVRAASGSSRPDRSRPVSFGGHPLAPAPVYKVEDLAGGAAVEGPAIVESPFTTICVDPGVSVVLNPSGSIVLRPLGGRCEGPTSHPELTEVSNA